jgi:uncharacterized membrane protein YphA (DoxX/SURF4 family)
VSSLLENDAVLWAVTSLLLFAPAAVVISLLAPPDVSALSTVLLGANALFAWTVGYWLVYRGGLDALRNGS